MRFSKSTEVSWREAVLTIPERRGGGITYGKSLFTRPKCPAGGLCCRAGGWPYDALSNAAAPSVPQPLGANDVSLQRRAASHGCQRAHRQSRLSWHCHRDRRPEQRQSSGPQRTRHLAVEGLHTVSNCTAQTISGGELAALTCGQNPDAAGPVQGKYILFGSADALAASFKTSIKDDALTTCGDAGQSPTPWHTGNSTTNSGQVACGTYQNGAEIIWTTDAKNVLSYIRGSNTDVPALYQWWKTNG